MLQPLIEANWGERQPIRSSLAIRTQAVTHPFDLPHCFRREVEHDRTNTQTVGGGEGARYRRVRSDARCHSCARGGYRRLKRQ